MPEPLLWNFFINSSFVFFFIIKRRWEFPSIPSLKLRYARRRTGPTKWICSQDFDADSDWLKYLQHSFMLLSVHIVLTATIFKDIRIWKNYASVMLIIPEIMRFLINCHFSNMLPQPYWLFSSDHFDVRKKNFCLISALDTMQWRIHKWTKTWEESEKTIKNQLFHTNEWLIMTF